MLEIYEHRDALMKAVVMERYGTPVRHLPTHVH